MRAPPLILLLALTACRPGTARTGAGGPDGDVPLGPLPRDVVPTAYALELTVVPARESFRGRTRIDVQVARPTRRIHLHGRDLQVASARVRAGEHVIAASYAQVDGTGVARLELNAALPAGPAQIEIDYQARFGAQLAGLYAIEHGGQRYAFTQFEPLEARRAFPCFDEPAFKTPFDISLTVPAGQAAITNTPQLGREPAADGLERVRFARTKPLPTYLVGISVGPFDVIDGPAIGPSPQRAEPLPLRGVAVAGQGARLAYALSHTGPLLLELERYYDIPYPYAKLDLIAVPDFGAGAMENAAAITFREWLLLLDATDAPEQQRRAFASVMAHELAHHWFGNLVTMPWWNDIWLNEGFATWSGHRTVEAVHPEHAAMLSLTASVQHVMSLDSRASARQVRQPVPTNRDMGNAFDGITYQKGAGVLTMFERYLGAEVFRAGVQAYLRERAFGVGASEDLLATLERVSGRPLQPAFRSFIEQVGVPLLEVAPACDGARASLALAQSRYLPLGSRSSREQRWGVPLCVRFGRGGEEAEHCALLEAERATIELPGQGCPDWVMPNAAGAGYYRWSLTPAWLARLRQTGYAKLSATERLSFADSLEAALASGDADAGDVLATLPALAGDAQREVALSPLGLLDFTREHLVDAARMPAFERFARELYGERLAQLGLAERQGEDGEARLLRASLARFMAEVARDPQVRTQLSALGVAYLGGPDGPLHPELVAADLRGVALRVALEDGDGARFDRALARLRGSQDAAERSILLSALSSVKRPEDSARALSLSFDPALRQQEVLVPVSSQMADPRTRPAAFAFMQARFDELTARASSMRAGRLPALAGSFCDAGRAREVEAFFDESRLSRLSGGARNLASAVESIESCAALVARQRASVAAFLDAR